MLKIDIHTHILPENWPDLRERYGYGGFVQLEHCGCNTARMLIDGKFFREIESNCWDPERRIREYQAHDCQVQVLSTVPVMFNYWAKPEHTYDLAKILNDHIAGVVAKHPKHFVGLGTLPMQDAALAIKELERCVKELGMPGVQIGSNINGMNLDAPELFPIFEAAEKLGACIFVHPWEMLGKDRTAKYWMPWLVGMPAETTLAICSVVFSGLLNKLPNLRIAFAHGGGTFPSTIGRIAHGYEARPDLCAQDNPVNPREYLSKIYYDSLVHDPDYFRFFVDKVGADRIALGTDYPFPLGELKPGELIESMGFDAEKQARLLHGTALEWLNLPKERFLPMEKPV
ncbi:MAG: amidohydrolase [Gammaproteobacteria bacterium]|nr:amidohydrolase [Gammaproteobacteria bacterium]